MGEETQDLKLQAKAVGFDQAAKDVDKVADAQKGLTDKVDGSGKAAEDQAESQQKSTAAASDYVAILSRLDPRLGALADSLLKATTITGSMDGKTVSLGDSLKKVTGFLNTNVGALKSFGAIAVAVFAAVAAAVQAMVAELNQANQAIQSQMKALDELKGKERDQQQALEDLRDAMRQGPFSPEQSQAALQTLQRIREQFAFISEDAVRTAVAFTGGAAGQRGGGPFSMEQIARTARLIQLPGKLELSEGMRPASAAHVIGRALTRFGPELDEQFAREAQQRAEQRARAGVEVAQQGGSTLNLRERIERRAMEGADIDRLLRLAQELQDLPTLERFQKLLAMAESGELPSLHVLRRLSQLGGMLGLDVGSLDSRLTASQSDISVLRGTFVEILNEQRKQVEAMQAASEALREQADQPRIYNQQNGKWFGADAASRDRRSRYGSKRLEERSRN